MTEQTEKRGRGHPPWTEEQKQARRELNAKKRDDREAEEKAAEQRYEEVKGRKRPKKYKRSDPKDPWTASQRRKNKEAWDNKFAERDKEYKQLIADNPHKTKAELGIPQTWKPRDGSPTGYYGVRLRQARVGIDLPPININNPHEVEHRIKEYFDFCEMNDKPPQLLGIANWLGVSYSTVKKWKTGDFSQLTPIIQRAMAVVEESLVEQVQTDPKSMVGGMFVLKTQFHYKESQDVVLRVGDEQQKQMSKDDIEKWFLEYGGKTVETEFVEEAEQE